MKESDIMATYFVIGTVIQLGIMAERYARLSEVREAWKMGTTWVIAPLFGIINILLWPIAIICEIMNIINGK